MRLSPSVAGAVAQAGGSAVPVATLVDAILAGHGDYLRLWPTTPPQWPSVALVQHPQRWLDELDPLVATDVIFGRIAILCLCLLDDDVAVAATSCGLLAGIVSEIEPRVADFLSPTGVRLLRRRAPTAAWSADLLPPEVDLLGVPDSSAVERIALPKTPPPSVRGVPTWVASYGGEVFAGRGEQSRSALQMGGAPAALAFSGEVLWVCPALVGGLIGYRIGDGKRVEDQEWPAVWCAAAGESAVAAYAAPDSDHPHGRVVWGLPGGGPVDLAEIFHEVSAVAVAGERVAIFAKDRFFLGGPDQEWREGGSFSNALTLAADEVGVVVGTFDGRVAACPWPVLNSTPVDEDRWKWTWVEALPGQQLNFLAAGGGRRLVASETEVALVRAGAVEARWRPEDGKKITAVAISPDGHTVAVGGTLMLKFWRLDVAAEVSFTAYTADTPDGVDLLGVQPTVDAIAALVAARAVEPPMSIGLFGAWGSGKSFFMRQVEDRVTQITRESQSSGRSQASIWAWRNIRHVRFNAWQYAAADVWAGLLEQLVGELTRRPLKGKLELLLPPELTELERSRIQRLAGAETAVGTGVDDLELAKTAKANAVKKVAKAQEMLRQARTGAARARTVSTRDVVRDATISALDGALTRANLPSLGQDLQDTWAGLAAKRRSTESLGALLAARRPLLVGALAAPPVAGLLLDLLLTRLNASDPALAGLVGTVLTLAAGVLAWVSSSLSDLSRRLRSIDAAEAAARAVEAEVRANEASARGGLQEAAAAVEQKRHEAEVAEEALVSARLRVASSTPGSLVEEYLEGRQQSDDYRASLGLIGIVRRDLGVISDGVQRHNKQLATDVTAELDDVVNRVVLYVDDLDRCRPEVVVKVLEAVSMLLSFPLFVVIVAVDSHWISRSLRSVYRDMLSDGQVTPDHYLEKIFQMPVWLDQPTPEAAASMVSTLLGGADLPPLGRQQSRGPKHPGIGPSGQSSLGPRGVPGQVTSGAGLTATQQDIALATTPPPSIMLDASEHKDITRLAPLLARSPRALKRYVNTYRLLKAVVEPENLALARLLLAAAVGRPDVGVRLFDAIGAGDGATALGTIIDGLEAADGAWLATAGESSWATHRCDTVRPVVAQVRRFVFRGDVMTP